MSDQAETANTFTAADRDDIVKNIRYLAGVDDGARSRDHQGFDGTDTGRGQYLALLRANAWKDHQVYWGWTRTRKYRRQLENAGLRTNIPEPPKAAYPQTTANRGVITTTGQPFQREIARTPDTFEIRFTYASELVKAVRELPGRTYKNGVNYVPLSQEEAVREFGLKFGFVWNSL